MAAVAFAAGFYGWYGNRHHFFDLHIYYDAMTWWAHGRPLYDYARPDPVQGALYFTYTPFAALVLLPMAAVPFGVVAAGSVIASVTLIVVTTSWLFRTPAPAASRARRWWLTGVTASLLLVIEPIRENLTLGQINMALVAMVLFDFCFAIPRGRRYAGVAIGLAAAIKLVPAIFIGYLLVTRRGRPFAVAAATAAGATLLAAAVVPHESWFYWTSALFDTDRVGHTFYTANQSLNGLLSRLVAPHEPNRLWWLLPAAAVTVAGFHRAVRAHRAGDDLTGVTLVGLVSALISPITWPHHIYWFVPALILLARHGRRQAGWRRILTGGAVGCLYALLVWGTVSFVVWGAAEAAPTTGLPDFLLRNALVLACLVLVAALPVTAARPAQGETGTCSSRNARMRADVAG